MTIFERLTLLEKQSGEFGFMWFQSSEILDQIQSECEEIRENMAQQGEPSHLQEEIGDLLHAVFSLCIFSDFDAEETLVKSVDKYEKRLQELKRLVRASGRETLQGQSKKVLMDFWNQAKEGAAL